MNSKDLVEVKREFIEVVTTETKTTTVPKEEKICTSQIEYLFEISEMRELNLEEIKKLEILVKTLMMVRGKVFESPKKKDMNNFKDEDLIKIIKG